MTQPSGLAAETPGPVVARGTCHALFAYEVALAIDLDEAERRVGALKERATLRHRRRAPRYFEYTPAPLRVTQAAPALEIGAFRTAGQVEVVFFDFGAVSVCYSIPLAGPLADLVALSEGLYDDTVLHADSRRRVETLLAGIGPALTRSQVAGMVESYAVFEVEEFTAPCPPASLHTTHAPLVAQCLRSEREPLGEQEVRDAVACRIAFGPDDLTLIDWDAALLVGTEMEDVRTVLEFANVELLELRYLDERLDEALDESYEALLRLSARWLRRLVPGTTRADLNRVARLQVDAAVLFENVNNALKLLGDQYLARVYRLASGRFHLAEWNASILRKLETLESIYKKMSDSAANWRMEVVEWVIVLLIAVSIVLPFFVPY